MSGEASIAAATEDTEPDFAARPVLVWLRNEVPLPVTLDGLLKRLAAATVPPLALQTVPAGSPPAEGPVLLFHHAPEVLLAEALATGSPPEEAMAAARAAAEAVVLHCRPLRHRLTLIDPAAAITAPAALASALAVRLGCEPLPDAMTEAETAAGAQPEEQEDAALLRLLAKALLMADPETRRLVEEFEAMMLPLPRPDAAPVALAAQALARLRASADRDLLLAQVAAMQDEIARLEAVTESDSDSAAREAVEAERLWRDAVLGRQILLAVQHDAALRADHEALQADCDALRGALEEAGEEIRLMAAEQRQAQRRAVSLPSEAPPQDTPPQGTPAPRKRRSRKPAQKPARPGPAHGGGGDDG